MKKVSGYMRDALITVQQNKENKKNKSGPVNTLRRRKILWKKESLRSVENLEVAAVL